MRTICRAEAEQDFDQLLLMIQDEPVCVQVDKRDVAVILSPEAFDRLLARRKTTSPNPLIIKLFEEGLVKRGAVYEALARWEAEHPETDSDK